MLLAFSSLLHATSIQLLFGMLLMLCVEVYKERKERKKKRKRKRRRKKEKKHLCEPYCGAVIMAVDPKYPLVSPMSVVNRIGYTSL